MINSAWLRLRYFRLHEPWWVEFWSSMTALMWARFVYWMPGDLGDQTRYSVLANIASDAQWEWMGFVLGAAQLACVLLGLRHARLVVALFMSWFWFSIGYGIWLSSQSVPGTSVYAGWGMANVTSMILLFRTHERR